MPVVQVESSECDVHDPFNDNTFPELTTCYTVFRVCMHKRKPRVKVKCWRLTNANVQGLVRNFYDGIFINFNAWRIPTISIWFYPHYQRFLDCIANLALLRLQEVSLGTSFPRYGSSRHTTDCNGDNLCLGLLCQCIRSFSCSRIDIQLYIEMIIYNRHLVRILVHAPHQCIGRLISSRSWYVKFYSPKLAMVTL